MAGHSSVLLPAFIILLHNFIFPANFRRNNTLHPHQSLLCSSVMKWQN